MAGLRRKMTNLLNNPKRWRERAEEARTIAAGMTDPETKRFMQSVAGPYEGLAERAERRARKSD